MLAQERGLELDEVKNQDLFELQHHHLLHCLEKTTVSYRCTWKTQYCFSFDDVSYVKPLTVLACHKAFRITLFKQYMQAFHNLPKASMSRMYLFIKSHVN